MAVYTNGIHLLADTIEELHSFAENIGLDRKWFVDHNHAHYDLIGKVVEKALIAGAIFKEDRFLVSLRNQSLPISSL